MEFKGKIIAVVEPKSGTTARGAWKMQQFVAESEGQFPHRLLFEVFGDERLQKFNIQMDDEVIIQFEPNARESKGLWFASNRAYDVQVGTQQRIES